NAIAIGYFASKDSRDESDAMKPGPDAGRIVMQKLFIIRRRRGHGQKERFVQEYKFSLFIALESALCWNT
ncbi:MAG TPA: hypothetical protein VHS97_13700, partial [Isosphaeraceae bacterium]|nr:hypothetical protein [Isosphaeraceae bacterium]